MRLYCPKTCSLCALPAKKGGNKKLIDAHKPAAANAKQGQFETELEDAVAGACLCFSVMSTVSLDGGKLRGDGDGEAT